MSRTAAEWLAIAAGQQERFWRKVDKSGPCWLWTAGVNKDGYGKFAITAPYREHPKQKHVAAHRLAWELENGPMPAELFALHSCDVRACVNPAHLRPGTQAENLADCVSRGRIAKGARHASRTHPERIMRGDGHYKAILTEDQVRDARAKRLGGISCVAIARELGRPYHAVHAAASGKTWKHVA